MSLEELGPRICIMGPSNSGKSTLADAIGRARGLPVIHLDQLFHLPNTRWQRRPEAEFIALHDEAIKGELWVMEGNYSRCLPQRLERATGFVLLDVPTTTSLFRYIRRSWFEPDRRGALDGGRDSVRWGMIRHIAVATRANRRRYREIFKQIDLPKVKLMTVREQAHFYRSAGLDSQHQPHSARG
jgi:adenylate kinase family enzyme